MQSTFLSAGLMGTVLALAMLGAGPSQAAIFYFGTELSGLNENPPVATPATGSALVTIDDVQMTMRVQASFNGLLGPTVAAHIHCCAAYPATAPVATQTPTFVGFPLGVSTGTYNHTFDMTDASSYNASFITNNGSIAGAFGALLTALADGRAYFNIHTTFATSGEIRGQFSPVPIPTALPLLASGLGALGFAGWRRRKNKRPDIAA